ncbi:ABC transporter ATP-binding protein [Pseudoclavibacter soli]|uniref:ABC transporter ATP-binding protein n=1 Tax=Pseudoclavibacter soli TaxID=452623 RepID=UPI000488BDDF|nr:ABC transporter ATP-binding protein [Pseudoclavibacter soli]
MSAVRPPRRGRPEDGPKASLRQLWPYLAEHRTVLIVTAVLSVLSALATVSQPLLVNQLITRVQQGETIGAIGWVIVILLVAAALVTGLQYYLLSRTGEGIVRSSRRDLVRHILRLPVAEIDRRRTGDLISRVSSDTTLLRAVLTQGLVDSIGGVFLLIGSIIGMLIIDPLLFALTAAVVAVAVFAVSLMARQVSRATRESQTRVGALSAAVERAVSATRTIRAGGATDRETASIVTEADGAYRSGLRVAALSSAVGPIVQLSLQVAVLVVLGVGGWRVAAGRSDIAGLVSFVLFLFVMMVPLVTMAGAFTSVQSALGALGRIQEILALPEETAADEVPAADRLSPPSAQDAIVFDDVRFGYPVASAPVLDGLSFRVPRGTKTALVGPSGAGKSTSLALLERFYDVTSGSVLVDGVDVRQWPRLALRAQFGYVEQDSPVLAGSIADNLRLAAPDATDEQCLAVLRQVNLEHLVQRDAAGLAAAVGEDGVMLSGGERQRLALARVLLAGPPVLLLDELTSSLDGLNEQLLNQAIEVAAHGRTLLVIAHRLATVIDADQIVVIDGGRAIASGTHAELLESSPLYRSLAEQQLLV